MQFKLKQVCDFYSGTGFPVVYQGKESGELPFYKVGDIAANVANGNDYLLFCNNYISYDEAKEIKGCILPKDVVVFAKIGEALKLNRRAITSCNSLIDNNAMGIAAKPSILDIRYFFYFMKNVKMETFSESTTVPSVRKSKLENIEINIPDIQGQKQIATTLDKLQSIITHRKQQLEKLDLLVKARFVEMFGDTEHNSKNFPIHKLCDLCTVSSSKRIYQNEQSSSGIPFLRISNLVDLIDNSHFETELFIPEDKYLELLENGLVPQKCDILVTSRGTLGKCYIIQSGDKFYFQDGMISWLYDFDDSITPLYLTLLFGTRNIERQISNLQSGSTVAYLSITMLKKLEIVVPPLKLQQEFAAFVEQTEKTKAAVQKALDEAQVLFDSLMQEYFG